jgi:hypothetical protein
MIQDKFGQLVFSEDDVCDLLMQGRDLSTLNNMLVDRTVNLEQAAMLVDNLDGFINYETLANGYGAIEVFHQSCQSRWHMPAEYKNIDIAEYVLGLCTSEAELQRCGHELLLYQERGLFDLLKFLKYFVDLMKQNNLIWGVGRGSSVSSYVLYKLEVHRIDSLFYELDVEEFLR